MDLTVLIEPKLDLERLSQVLDGLGHEGRVHCVRGWDKKTISRLFEAAKGFRPLDLSHFVPDGVGPLTEVIHDGKNSLPAFSHFQKRFAKPSAAAKDAEGKLWGYNHQVTEWLAPLIGPGYFVALVTHAAEGPDPGGARDAAFGEKTDQSSPSEASGEEDKRALVDIDYKILPLEKCSGWPEIEGNGGRGALVYGGMVDHMRGLSQHVSIGRAEKGGKLMDAYFVLVRRDAS